MSGMIQKIIPKMLAGNSRRYIKEKTKKRPALEILNWSFYHRRDILAIASQNIVFFRGAKGSLQDTNLVSGGFLPYPQSFDIFGISIVVDAGVSQANMLNLYNNAVVVLSLSNKPYVQIPLARIPSASGFHGSSTANNVFQVQNCLPFTDNIWKTTIGSLPLHVPSQQDFAMEIQTYNVNAFNQPFHITAYLDGILARPVL